MADNFYLIILNGIDETQRTLIHASIKDGASEWWHQLPDVWIAKGAGTQGLRSEVQWWRDRLKVFVPHAPSSLLVFLLPPEGKRAWSAKGMKSTWAWLETNYATPGGNPLPPF